MQPVRCRIRFVPLYLVTVIYINLYFLLSLSSNVSSWNSNFCQLWGTPLRTSDRCASSLMCVSSTFYAHHADQGRLPALGTFVWAFQLLWPKKEQNWETNKNNKPEFLRCWCKNKQINKCIDFKMQPALPCWRNAGLRPLGPGGLGGEGQRGKN